MLHWNQCSDSDTFHSRSLTAHHGQLRTGFVSVAIVINLTQKPTNDTSSEKDDVFHEDRIGLQGEEVHISSYVSVSSCTCYLCNLLLVY